jgi:L-asparaginase II
MRRHPFLVAGTGRLCTDLMTMVPGLAMKIGAEGLLCGVLTEGGIAFALKCRDGSPRGRDAAAVHLLKLLGVLGPAYEREADTHVRGRGMLQQA